MGLQPQGLGFDPPPRKRHKGKAGRKHRDSNESAPTHHWNTGRSERSRHYPPDWGKLREIVRERAGGKCQIRDPEVCIGTGSDCDHIDNTRDENGNYNDSITNLRWSCRPCHNRHTSQQGNEQQRINRERINRPPEQHPGLSNFEPPDYPKYDNHNTTSGKDNQDGK